RSPTPISSTGYERSPRALPRSCASSGRAGRMPNPEQLTEFAAPPFNSLSDVRGDPLNADLRILFAGNQYMVLPELMSAFDGEGPRSVFYETLPPGILIQQFLPVGIRIGSLE